MGQPPYILTDRTIEQASAPSNRFQLPKSLHHAISMQMFCNRIHAAMADVDRLEGTASHLNRASLLKSLEFELQEIERQSGQADCRMSHRPHNMTQSLIPASASTD